MSKTLGCDLQVRMRVTWSQIGAWSLRVGERSAEAGARKVRTERHPAFITEPPRRISSACGLSITLYPTKSLVLTGMG